MTQAQMVSLAAALGITFGVYKFSHNPAIKAAALGVLGVVVAKQIPYVKDAIA